MEQNLRFQEGLRHENESLKMSLNDYKSKLEECQVQIGESHAELLRLEQLAKRLQEKTPVKVGLGVLIISIRFTFICKGMQSNLLCVFYNY